jgi:hypothetical protein
MSLGLMCRYITSTRSMVDLGKRKAKGKLK